MKYQVLVLAAVLTFVACDSGDGGVSGGTDVSSSSSAAVPAKSSADAAVSSGSVASLSSGAVSLSSSSAACVTSVNANITISSIENMNISCGASTAGWTIYDTDRSVLMTCTGGAWVTTPVVLCGTALSSSSAAVNSSVTYGSLTDARDGKTYKTVTIGGAEWMAENLNFYESSDGTVKIDSSFCYDNLQSNCDVYGRLYQMFSVSDACPAGTHLPTTEEWTALRNALRSEFNVTDARDVAESGDWENGAGTNTSGFGALPGGFRQKSGLFVSMSEGAYFWGYDSTVASERSFALNDSYEFTMEPRIYVNASYSLRCVKD